MTCPKWIFRVYIPLSIFLTIYVISNTCIVKSFIFDILFLFKKGAMVARIFFYLFLCVCALGRDSGCIKVIFYIMYVKNGIESILCFKQERMVMCCSGETTDVHVHNDFNNRDTVIIPIRTSKYVVTCFLGKCTNPSMI